jgi:hypothetical protein
MPYDHISVEGQPTIWRWFNSVYQPYHMNYPRGKAFSGSYSVTSTEFDQNDLSVICAELEVELLKLIQTRPYASQELEAELASIVEDFNTAHMKIGIGIHDTWGTPIAYVGEWGNGD